MPLRNWFASATLSALKPLAEILQDVIREGAADQVDLAVGDHGRDARVQGRAVPISVRAKLPDTLAHWMAEASVGVMCMVSGTL